MNRMRVEELYCDGEARKIPGGGGAWAELLLAMALSNDAGHGPTGTVLGDPTEVALMVAAQGAGVEKATQQSGLPRVAELPFDSDRKCMTTVHRDPAGGFVSFTKGSIEAILPCSKEVRVSTGVAALLLPELVEVGERMASDGLRVLAVAVRHWGAARAHQPGDSRARAHPPGLRRHHGSAARRGAA